MLSLYFLKFAVGVVDFVIGLSHFSSVFSNNILLVVMNINSQIFQNHIFLSFPHNILLNAEITVILQR